LRAQSLEWVQVADVKWSAELERSEDFGLRRFAISAAVIRPWGGDDQRQFRANQDEKGECDQREVGGYRSPYPTHVLNAPKADMPSLTPPTLPQGARRGLARRRVAHLEVIP
jgi:hypothetical protein